MTESSPTKIDPTLAEWIGIHDQLTEIEIRLQRIFEQMSDLTRQIGIVADREY